MTKTFINKYRCSEPRANASIVFGEDFHLSRCIRHFSVERLFPTRQVPSSLSPHPFVDGRAASAIRALYLHFVPRRLV
ncbi:hypothetical protein M378DRAFT_160424 [Amanita muscaria Koide BX008]|uniref:Uncharacterized protein n=1 Tax=Amanita muscaria (strain Koide BX008) TaxID=946122 RepID=A0A0C2SU19_AMAMK|nr:hypothetical protein M378DRAFT_160424 [Amanita muscaria Koide BX008]